MEEPRKKDGRRAVIRSATADEVFFGGWNALERIQSRYVKTLVKTVGLAAHATDPHEVMPYKTLRFASKSGPPESP